LIGASLTHRPGAIAAEPLDTVSSVRLARLAHVAFTPAPDPDLQPWTAGVDDIVVEAGRLKSSGSGGFLLIASVPLVKRPTSTPDGLRVPLTPRRRAEEAIESTANAVSVAVGRARGIASPYPYVGLMPDSVAEREWLDSTRGFIPLPFHQIAHVGTPRDLELVGRLGNDRPDGIALLAEALAHTHSTGRFHDLIRVFERAFTLGVPRLPQPMARFLRGARLGYSRREIEHWMLNLRNPITHANRPTFRTEADVRLVTYRMEQAAYDVVLNKAIWADPSTRRRNRWKPATGTRSASGQDVFIEQGSTGVSLNAQILDGFGTYPLHLRGMLTAPPKGVWWRVAGEEGSTRQFRVRVTPR
jgi:hypothetical protein